MLMRNFTDEGETLDIVGLDHAAVLTSDVEKAREFYGGVLGMEEIPRPSTFDFPGVWLKKNGAEVHIIGETENGRARQVCPTWRPDELVRGFGTHVAFEVADLDEAQRHLASLGVELVGPPRPRGDGPTQMYLTDPDGHLVEIFAWPTRPADR